MKLLKLTLENFQGLKAFTFEPNGHSADIFSDNGRGKTTVFNAITWLLFDRPSTGAKNYSPKTRDAHGEVHNLEHSAEGTFRLDDGKIITFKKSLHEVYRKKRGSAESEFTGNTVDYYINGVPAKATDFTSEIARSCGPMEQVMMILMPNYFAETMSWQDRRRILFDVCGDIPDDEIIASDPKLSELKELLLIPGTTDQYYSVDNLTTMQKSRMKEINKRLDDIPVRIDEAAKAVKDAEGLPSREELNADLISLRDEVEGMSAPDRTAVESAEAALSGLQKKIKDAEVDYTDQYIQDAKPLQKRLAELREKGTELYKAYKDALTNEHTLNYEWTQKGDQRIAYLEQYNRELSKTWDTSKETCPTCHQKLPTDRVEALRLDFESHRREVIAQLKVLLEGEYSEQAVAIAKSKYEQARILLEEADRLRQACDDEERELDMRLSKKLPPFEETEEYAKLKAEYDEAQQNLLDEQEKTADAVFIQKQRIEDLNNTIENKRRQLYAHEIADAQNKRIAELEEEETRLAKEYQRAEKTVHLCELFIKAKVDAVTANINRKFQRVKFRLFIDQINGGVKEDCEVMIPTDDGKLIPYAFANTAGRMNAGLEIIAVLSEAFGFTMPVVIDNAEAVSPHNWKTIPGTQIIRLFVSEADKTLRIEIGE